MAPWPTGRERFATWSGVSSPEPAGNCKHRRRGYAPLARDGTSADHPRPPPAPGCRCEPPSAAAPRCCRMTFPGSRRARTARRAAATTGPGLPRHRRARRFVPPRTPCGCAGRFPPRFAPRGPPSGVAVRHIRRSRSPAGRSPDRVRLSPRAWSADAGGKSAPGIVDMRRKARQERTRAGLDPFASLGEDEVARFDATARRWFRVAAVTSCRSTRYRGRIRCLEPQLHAQRGFTSNGGSAKFHPWPPFPLVRRLLATMNAPVSEITLSFLHGFISPRCGALLPNFGRHSRQSSERRVYRTVAGAALPAPTTRRKKS